MKRSLLAPVLAAPLVLLPTAPALAAPTTGAAGTAAAASSACPAVVTLPDGFAPEGITSGPGTRFFVGSLANGAVYRGDLATGRGRVLVPGEQGRVAVGMEYDRANDRLWVAGGPTGTVTVYGATSGRRLARYPVPSAGFLNDVAVTRDAVYVTDSFRAQLVVIPLGEARALPAEDRVRRVPLTGDLRYAPGQAFNANGIVSSPDGRSVVVVQSVTGKLFRVDPGSGRTREVGLKGDPLVNGDGMERRGNTVYVVRNRDNRVAVVELAADARTARVVDTLTSDAFDVPTTATLAGGALWAVNARFGTPVEPTTEYTVVRLPARNGRGGPCAPAPRGGVAAGGGTAAGIPPAWLGALGGAALAGAGVLAGAARRGGGRGPSRQRG